MDERNLEAHCGLYCGACPIYLRQYDGWLVRAVAERVQCETESLRCQGCRSGMVSPSCRDCPRRDCAQAKGFDSCAACPDMPCEWTRNWRLPHGADVVPNLEALRDRGSAAWLAEQADHWRCPSCGKAGSWYERICRQCGTALPSAHEPPQGP